MSFDRDPRDKADESLISLLAELPQLVRNLVDAEVTNAKSWAAKAAKDYGIGTGWFVGALFVLFWMIPVLLVSAIAALSLVWPVWLAALVVALGMLLVIAGFVLLGVARFKRTAQRESPVVSVMEDIETVREVGREL